MFLPERSPCKPPGTPGFPSSGVPLSPHNHSWLWVSLKGVCSWTRWTGVAWVMLQDPHRIMTF